MPKKPQLPPQRPQLRLTGSIHTQVYKDGRIIMRKWPRKRPGPGTPAQQANRFLTGWVWWATKFRVSQEVDAANKLAPKTLYVPRDLLEMATFGRLIQVNASNGVTWYGVKLLTSQVQALLDQLGTTVGTIITRTADGWDIILPSTDGYVLTTHGNNTIPTWQAPSGGSGGSGPKIDWLNTGAVKQPLITDFTLAPATNQTTSSVTETASGLQLAAGVQANDWNSSILTPLTGDNWTFTALVQLLSPLDQYDGFGIVIDDTAAKRAEFYGLSAWANTIAPLSAYQRWFTDGDWGLDTYAGDNDFSGPQPVAQAGQPIWLRLVRFGTTLNFLTALDGETWLLLGQSTTTHWVTNPNYIGVGINPRLPTYRGKMAINLYSAELS